MPRGPGPMQRLATHYKVPIKRGRRVRFGTRFGRITSVRNGYLRVSFDAGRASCSMHARETGLVYLNDDGTVLCDPCLCSKCGLKKPLYYHLCKGCLPESYARIVGVDISKSRQG